MARGFTRMAFAVLAMSMAPILVSGSELEKGIIYVQPSYHYSNTLSLDLEVLKRDLVKIAGGGFKNLGLRVSFGELITHWDPATATATYNETKCAVLGDIAEEATAHGIRLIFNTHLLDTVPQGIDGAYFVNSSGPDIFGVFGGNGKGVWRSRYLDVMVRESYTEPLKLFHRKFASCFRTQPSAPHFWKHAFESCYLFPSKVPPGPDAQLLAGEAIKKFGQWAYDTNPSLQYWRDRWAEPDLETFGNISLPLKLQPHGPTTARIKNGDFWRFWLLGVLKHGKYGLSIGDIYHALVDGAAGAFGPQLAFKHWRPANFVSQGNLTHAELVDAFDLPINATALGYYVNDPTQLALEPSGFQTYVSDVKDVAPARLPLIVWETGSSTFNITLTEQAEWAHKMMVTATQLGVHGFNWWQWVDWAPYPSEPCVPTTQGVTQCELFHFGAHFINGTAKPVWDVLVAGPPE